MKVGIVCAFDTYFDRVSLLKEYYEEKGAEVKVYSSDFSHRKKTKIPLQDPVTIQISTRPYQKNLSIARIRSHIDFSKRAYHAINSQVLDVLHVLIPCNSLAKTMSMYKRKHPQTRLIFDLIDLWPETMPISKWKNRFPFTVWKNVRDRYLDTADLVYTECDLFHRVLHQEGNPKFHTLYWARQEMPLQRKMDLKENEISFCYLGSMNNIIDIDFIAQFCETCSKYKKVKLHLIGDGESKKELIYQVKMKKVEVIDHNKVFDQVEKQKIFDQCHFGFNVMKENVVVGLTMKSLDYMCGQLPIINTIPGDTKDFCEKENIGFHVSHDCIKPMAKVICGQTIQENSIQRENIKSLYLRYFTKQSFVNGINQTESMIK
ncbi:hypothetical protein HNQ43_001081 [Faecalicoccus acidiformans]|uniref:Glycosyltransferase WbuB n=1 Tax=Faecalicoccus acidiformans TaxID=915173 RepID=A0A7W8FX85_9FIRM|nr:hypothetical protein [Faecalicoccus acidiformans]MBB5185033.1 hypothetical protein [Faecalicoccus acidiformans]